VVSFPDSSAVERVRQLFLHIRAHCLLTAHRFLHIIQNQIHQLVISFEKAANCTCSSVNGVYIYIYTLTFSPAIEFHLDLLIHVFGEVENVFLLGLLLPLLLVAGTATGTATSVVMGGVGAASSLTASAAATTTAPAERASLGHHWMSRDTKHLGDIEKEWLEKGSRTKQRFKIFFFFHRPH
jgi:hypothetical protein